MIFFRFPFRCDLKCLEFGDIPVKTDLIKDTVESYLRYNEFTLLYNGRRLQDMEVIPDNSTIHITFSLPGGKGGFGSMLRAIGAQIEKTTNREACRDLSGRRLRDINEEQRLKKWISKEAEREAEKIQRRQARIERLKTKAPHKFFDYEYEKEISELPDRVNEALSEGLQKVNQPKKRPHEKSGATKLPKKAWLSEDLPLTSSDSDSDETNVTMDGSPCKKSKISSNDSVSYESDISESSQPQPGSSKDFITEESTSNDTNSTFTDAKSEENSTDSEKVDLVQLEENKYSEDVNNAPILDTKNTPEKNKTEYSTEEMTQGNKDTEKKSEAASISNNNAIVKQAEVQDDTPINLLDFQSLSDLEALGLNKLKSALMSRGLKCGGSLSDRAQRLWKVRGLQPCDYPANLLAKNKK